MQERWNNYIWRQLENVLYLWIAVPLMLLSLIAMLIGFAVLVWLYYGAVPFVIFAIIMASLFYKQC